MRESLARLKERGHTPVAPDPSAGTPPTDFFSAMFSTAVAPPPAETAVKDLPLDLLDPWRDEAHRAQPFKPYAEKELLELAENIRQNGVISPIRVRSSPFVPGRFQILAGHNRVAAARLAGLTTVPAITLQATDDEAKLILVDSNLYQREHLLPSEKAFAYKLKMEALSHQGVACGRVGHKSRDAISDTDSGRQVQRYIRLTHLIPELLEKMDREEIALSVGVELSYLDEYSQQDVLEQCEINDCTPSYSQAWRMHKADREGLLTRDVIQLVMNEEKPNQRETVKVPADRLREVLPKGLDAHKTEDFIIKACEHYRKYLIRQHGREER